jgi:hypothetical protein
MTREDVIRIAREAGFVTDEADFIYPPKTVRRGIGLEIERVIVLAAAAEREAVGNIILDYAGRDDLSDSDESLLKHLFELIRARGEE